MSDAPRPDLEDVQQQDPEYLPPLDVTVCGSVRTHVLPSRSGASRNYISAADAIPLILLGQDLRRRRAVIIGDGGAFYIGQRDDCANGSAAIWPDATPLVIEHTEQVYVRAVTGSAVISVIAENWAD